MRTSNHPLPTANYKGRITAVIIGSYVATAWIGHLAIHAVVEMEGLTDSRTDEASTLIFGLMAILCVASVLRIWLSTEPPHDPSRGNEH